MQFIFKFTSCSENVFFLVAHFFCKAKYIFINDARKRVKSNDDEHKKNLFEFKYYGKINANSTRAHKVPMCV